MKNDTIYSNRLLGILQKKVAYAIMPLGKKAKKNYKVQESQKPLVFAVLGVYIIFLQKTTKLRLGYRRCCRSSPSNHLMI